MKNFYEATVIRESLTHDIILTLEPVEWCYCRLTINDTVLLSKVITEPTVLEYKSNINDSIDIKIDSRRQHPGAVLVKLTINDINILPDFKHMSNPPTDYLSTNGSWQLYIDHFYKWYYNVSGKGEPI
mgnify:CR=1 FL=1